MGIADLNVPKFVTGLVQTLGTRTADLLAATQQSQ